MSLLSKYSEGAKKALELAEKEAVGLGHPFIGTEHLLLGVVAEGGEAKSILEEFGVNQEQAREAVAKTVGDVAGGSEAMDALEPLGVDLRAVKKKAEEAFGEGALKIASGRPRFTPRSARSLELAVGKAAISESDLVEPLHILQSLMSDPGGFAAQIVEQLTNDSPGLQSRLRSV